MSHLLLSPLAALDCLFYQGLFKFSPQPPITPIKSPQPLILSLDDSPAMKKLSLIKQGVFVVPVR